jgi:hypothetical protein
MTPKTSIMGSNIYTYFSVEGCSPPNVLMNCYCLPIVCFGEYLLDDNYVVVKEDL